MGVFRLSKEGVDKPWVGLFKRGQNLKEKKRRSYTNTLETRGVRGRVGDINVHSLNRLAGECLLLTLILEFQQHTVWCVLYTGQWYWPE